MNEPQNKQPERADQTGRFSWERPDKEKLRYLKRKQDELESKRALADFKRHLNEEQND